MTALGGYQLVGTRIITVVS